jgi:anti-sigma regulatory factor (Ser/Thr protein kinase)
VIELPRGLLGIAIGDVVGHGIRAAALMGQLRTALHAYAREGHGPGHTLELVDRFTQSMSESPMVTVAYGVFDPETNVLRFSIAGHPPPIVISGALARLVEVPPGPPLGAFPYSSAQEHELTLAAGDLLVLYTDGLVERRAVAIQEGLDELLEALNQAVSAEDACLLAIDQMVPAEGPRDDVAIVALQNGLIPSTLYLRLATEPRVLAQVRRTLRRWLRQQGAHGDELAEIPMAVSEACANAIEHAYSPAPATFEIEASEADGEVSIIVRDTGRWRPTRGQHRGRGLTIMEAAMDVVEVSPSDTGTEVRMRRRLSR